MATGPRQSHAVLPCVQQARRLAAAPTTMFHRTAKTPSQRGQQAGLVTRLRGRATAAAFGMAARRRSSRGMAALLGAGLEYLPPYGPSTRPLLWMLGKEGLNEDVLATFDDQPWARPADLPRGF